jgi:hypothetical protein
MASLDSLQPFAVDDKKIAVLIGMSLGWVRKDRATKRTIPFFRVGDCVRYDVATVRAVMNSRTEGGNSKSSKQGATS